MLALSIGIFSQPNFGSNAKIITMYKHRSKILKVILIWLLIGGAVYSVVTWLEHAQKNDINIINGVIEINKNRDGHYYWTGDVNGQEVSFLIDTGASRTAIPDHIAKKANLTYGARVQVQTANGTTQNYTTQGNLCLAGGVCVNNLEMLILPTNTPEALLGMDVISKLTWSQKEGVMRFE